MDFLKTMSIAASGLRAQAGRMRIISENIANAELDAGDRPAPIRTGARWRPSPASSIARSKRARSSSARCAPTSPTSV